MDFSYFYDFCKGPVQDFSKNVPFLERSFSIFAILAIIFYVIFMFSNDFRDFDWFRRGFEAFSLYLCDFIDCFSVIFMDSHDFHWISFDLNEISRFAAFCWNLRSEVLRSAVFGFCWVRVLGEFSQRSLGSQKCAHNVTFIKDYSEEAQWK